MNEAIIEKLKKILARASEGRGASEAEMQTAMAMAQKLAVENNIDLASITLDEATGIEVERADVSSTRSDSRRPHHHNIWQVLMSCFEVRLILLGGSRFAVIGEKTDIALATFCFHWLDKLYLQAYREFERQYVPSFHTEAEQRRGFYHGLTRGIIANNQKAKKEAVAAVAAESSDAYALVVVKKEEAVEALVKAEFPHLRAGRSSTGRIDRGAAAAGFRKGSTIKLQGQLG